MAVAAARARGMRVLLRDEQTLLHRRPPHIAAAKEIALRALYSQCSALYIGEENRRYFARYGMPPERMHPARYCVDNTRLQRAAAELAPRRPELRASVGITDDAPVVLFAGKLIAKKQPLALIEAFSRVRAETPCWLLVAGDGPLRAAAERMVDRLRTPDVRFTGFLDEHRLPEAYAAGDVFVLPSRLHETWGLVVNEAMNFGLPVVVSDKVGCAADLVRSGENGVVVAHDSVAALAAAIRALVTDGALRKRFGAASRRIVDSYSIEACADGIVAACTQGTKWERAWKQRDTVAA
jgi:glycosyltransferase involved in cell wall biosynthesis